MPTVINQLHPFLRIHDRHPMLHGLFWLALCLLLLLAFLMSVMPGVWALTLFQDCTGLGAQVHT